ncbi:S-protein homolog 2-like [Impatiens glandulifera]|uniref:S-protein homolog 2-like n=1 Tax=Impatiens glandulifera TaxID=253017 RepID=UPI001FB1493E|nr:S-protein homolog 2-like [Impatiens glandulifera]
MTNKLVMIIGFIALAVISTVTAARQFSDDGNPTAILKASVPIRHMNITNELHSNVMLKMHCKSEDDDLGDHSIAYGESLYWSFKSKLFIHTTVFTCSMSWDSISGTFDVYRATRDDSRCAEKCWWRIRTDGAFSYNEQLDRWDLLYDWSTPA